MNIRNDMFKVKKGSKVRRQSWLIMLTICTSTLLFGSFLMPDSAAAAPVITSVTPSISLKEADPGILIDGSGFSAAPTAYLTKNNDWNNPGTKVEQVLTGTPGSTQIEFTVTTCGLTFFPTPIPWDAYLWVVDETGVPNAAGFPVQLTLVKDNTPPGAASYQDGQTSPQIFPPGGYINSGLDAAYPILPPVFSIQSKFYESSRQSPVQCFYSLDDGLTWTFMYDATPMSTGAVYCTDNSVSAPGGPVAIKMRACSPCGGCGDTITKNRVVDTTGPESGASFTATPGSNECTLAWSTTTDTGIGMHATEPYQVYIQVDTGLTVDPPGSCSGFNIYAGTDTSKVHSPLKVGHDYYFKLCYQDAYNNISSYNGNPVECVLPGIILAPGVNFTSALVKPLDQDVPVDTFTLSTNMASGTVTGLTIRNYSVPSTTSNISNVKLYNDDGSVPDEFDPGDTFIASTIFTGDNAVFTGLSIPVSPTPMQYITTYSIIDTPTHGALLRGYVSSVVSALPYSGGDNESSGLTVDAIAPTTTDNTPATWQNNEITVTLYNTDGPVDAATGIYGCLGSGCTPIVLGGRTMTTSCGAGNACTYAVRYYSVDTPGNIESVKTAANQAKVDRAPPGGGTFTATSDTSPIYLEWNGFTDAGSGINTYQVKRVLGSTPPADCSTGTRLYPGTNNWVNDSAYLVNGQEYSYRLCVFDVVGNASLAYTATVTFREPCVSSLNCNNCHGTPPVDGVKYPPGGHPLHTGISCDQCHREGGDPYHVDGIVTLTPETGSNMGDIAWPGPIGMSCGGQGFPVGGDLGGGMMGCHTMGTPNNPGLTPEWECIWDSAPICYPPFGP